MLAPRVSESAIVLGLVLGFVLDLVLDFALEKKFMLKPLLFEVDGGLGRRGSLEVMTHSGDPLVLVVEGVEVCAYELPHSDRLGHLIGGPSLARRIHSQSPPSFACLGTRRGSRPMMRVCLALPSRLWACGCG